MSDKVASSRSGFLAGGNFIVDTVKIIDAWPEQDALASIRQTSRSNGGGPYNVLKNLSRLVPQISREAIGLIGDDVEGGWILDDCAAAGIDTRMLRVDQGLMTSTTDVMTVAGTGRRTFFHARGANAVLDVQHFDFSQTTARVFLLGYLMLLDTLDQLNADGSTGASQVLNAARRAGLIAAVDCVSTDHPQFREIAGASLCAADVFFLNEVEASKILGHPIDIQNSETAIREIMQLGAHGTVVLHLAGGALALESSSANVIKQPAINVPNEKIVGASGAGDAFATGYLWGVHEGWSIQQSLHCAVSTAATSLFAATPSNGLNSMEECLHISSQYGFRTW